MPIVDTDRKRVLVVGAHRSGTTLASAVLADELGYAWMTETHVSAGQKFCADRVVDAMNGAENVVMHGASSFSYLDMFVRRVKSLAVVFVWRDPRDVLHSQSKVQDGRQLDVPEQKLLDFVASMRAAQAGHHRVEHHLIVYPHSLWHHRLWTPDDERQTWRPRQISPAGLAAHDADGSVLRDE